jgi:16S rRNA C967 or C1407 C5-methylase (RsmB/RsmF family)
MHHHLIKKNNCFPVPESMVKFVNGVLRKLSTPSDEAENPERILYGHKLLEKTSVSDNIAPWLLKRWENDWGDTLAKLILNEMMPSSDNQWNTRIDVTTKYSMESIIERATNEDSQSSSRLLMDEMQASFGEDCILLPHGSLRIGTSLGGDVSQWPGYDDGTWWVQDSSSTLPALVLSQALSKKHESDISSLHVVDMCSAPGGKACQLLTAGFGRVTAIEANERRSKRLIENLQRLKLSEQCEVLVGEGQKYRPQENEQIEGILLDVPCSATGTGARQPDVLRRSSDLTELLNIQELLVNHCVDEILRPGGIMVYATCSILKVSFCINTTLHMF